MKTVETGTDPEAFFRRLAAKYAVDPPGHWRLKRTVEEGTPEEGIVALVPGWSLLGKDLGDRLVPLFPWRSQRRLVELRRLVEQKTIDTPLVCRLMCLTADGLVPLGAILYRLFDLAEWLTGSPIVALCASMAAGRSANVIARLASGAVCSLEAGATLPATATPAILDRHELVSRRGVASDRVVDTQVPQDGLYTFTGAGRREYTDPDGELFGLEAEEVGLVRAAYELATQPERAETHRVQHRRLERLVARAFESDRHNLRLEVEGDGPCGR